MKRTLTLWLVFWLLASIGWSQGLSTNTVRYRVGYDAASGLYTAYVIPDYSSANANNPLPNEFGATAQFTLVVPVSFSITAITDIRGFWDKAPFRLGPGQPGQTYPPTVNPAFNYYPIGKAPVETNYGPFAAGVPVALFSFRGNGCFGPIQPLAANDPFIAAARQSQSLNVGNSFYSRSGQPPIQPGNTGNQDPREQFVAILGPPADCTPRSVSAVADAATTFSGVAVTTTVLANDTNTGGPASITNVSVSVATPPSVGTALANADGSISYTPPVNFTGVVCYTYQICDRTSPSVCSSTSVCVTVSARPAGSADIQISKVLVGAKVRTAGEMVSFQVVVSNLGPDGASNVVVKDSLGTGLEYVSSSSSGGSLSWPLLSIPLLASGSSVTLVVQCRVVGDGISFNYARVISADQVDPNGTNNVAQACVSVPLHTCSGQGLLTSVPAQYTNVQWYKDGVLVGSGNSITLVDSGSYTFTASNASCPAEGCCPLVVVSEVCCPARACVPFVITKVKRR